MIEVNDNIKKMRKGNIVVYDIDFLLDNLAREVYLLESYRQHKNHPVIFTNDESITSDSTLVKKGEVQNGSGV